MKRLLLPVVILLFTSAAVAAQSIVFRSGEHDGFTRIVANLPPGTEWQIVTEDEVLRLALKSPPTVIDISNVFSRISRERILDVKVRPNNQSIDILLACACGFRATLEDNSLLVIDIGERFTRQIGDQVGDNWNSPLNIENMERRTVEIPLVTERSNSPFRLPLKLTARNADVASQMNNAPQHRHYPFEIQTPKQTAKEATNPNLEGLNVQISGAMSQGLLIPSSLADPVPRETRGDQLSGERHPNLRTTSANEAVTVDEIPEAQGGAECPPREDFNIVEWGHESGFAAGLSEWRKQLMQEFDKVDADAAIGLARHYLYYGFGQEAQATLDLLSPSSGLLLPSSSQIEHFRFIARIIDFGYDPLNEDTSWMKACDGEAVLWSVLSAKNVTNISELEDTALSLAFEALPRHLKQHLGPELAKKLTQSGYSPTAENILFSVGRGQTEPTSAFEYAQAKQSLNEGNAEAASAPLSSVLKANSEFSPLALVALINAAVAADQPIDESLVDLVAAYQFENRKTELSGELSRAHVLALSFSGQFAEALERLEQLEDESSTSGYSETRSLVMTRLLVEADDIEFLDVAMSEPIVGLSTVIENRFAQRLLDLGFPEDALEILTEAADGEDGLARRLLRAKAALSLNEPVVAEAELLGLSSDDAYSLRAESRRLQGDFSAVFPERSEAYTEQQIQDLAWLAGNRPLAGFGGSQNDQGLRDLDRAISPVEQLEEVASSSGILDQAKSLIKDSSQARVALEDVLSRFKVEAELVQ